MFVGPMAFAEKMVLAVFGVSTCFRIHTYIIKCVKEYIIV